MKKYLPCAFLGVFLAGCATISSVDKNYQKINWQDGISRNEAFLIAKKHLIAQKEKPDYQVIAPFVRTDQKAKAQPNVWFVAFHPRKVPLLFKYYLVVVDKKTGEILEHGVRKW